jgi:precorrin-6A/cobalt-precorrin-6A reductase
MALRVLLLAGTAEARRLAAAVGAQRGIELTSSLAGAVAVPLLPEGDVRIGGFGAGGLTGWLRDHPIDAVVDATHPFATRMTDEAVAAAAELRLPLLVLRRPGWTAGPGDRWHRVPDMAAAAALAPRLGERAFLATGAADFAAFTQAAGWFLLRADEPPTGALPARHHFVLGPGLVTADAERALLREHRIEVLVCRDSGGDLTAAKLVAARELGLPVVMVDRPPAPHGVPTVATVEEAVEWLRALP